MYYKQLVYTKDAHTLLGDVVSARHHQDVLNMGSHTMYTLKGFGVLCPFARCNNIQTQAPFGSVLLLLFVKLKKTNWELV